MISIATHKDIPAIVQLANSAYRGEGSKKGWTTEADMLDGEVRIDEEAIAKMMSSPRAAILKYENNEQLLGCVYLAPLLPGNELYLGLLSVSPDAQTGGIGKQLLAGAEKYALEQGCTSITMNVISKRLELIAWYVRHGYEKTGETKPFPSDNKFGVPKEPLEFIVLEKKLGV